MFEDLWQFSHITASYVVRAFTAAVLLAYGMSWSSGDQLWHEDWSLAVQGTKALVPKLHSPPMQFVTFQTPLVGLAISALVLCVKRR